MSSGEGYSVSPSDLEGAAAAFQALHEAAEMALQNFKLHAEAVHPDAFGRTIHAPQFWSQYHEFHGRTVSGVKGHSEASLETSKRLQAAAENYRNAEQANAKSAGSAG